mgnify:CR=1 FL=1
MSTISTRCNPDIIVPFDETTGKKEKTFLRGNEYFMEREKKKQESKTKKEVEVKKDQSGEEENEEG